LYSEVAGAVPIQILGQILMQILDALDHVHRLPVGAREDDRVRVRPI